MTRNVAILIAIIVAFTTTFIPSTTISYAGMNQQKTYEKVIAHGGGFYQGYETTNSIEAVKEAVKNGYQLIELDMEISSDDKIIMLHDWDRTALHYYGTSFSKRISESQFLNLSIHGELQVLTFDRLISVLDQAPSIKIVTDTKGDNIKLLTLIAQKYPKYVERIIPQIYDYEELNLVKELGYTDIIFTLYNQVKVDIEILTDFAIKNDLYAVTMPDYFADRGYCKMLANSGIIVYVHPIASIEKAMFYMDQGACGVYSGTLLPEELMGIEKDYYLAAADENGELVKLTDKEINDLSVIKMKGLKTGESVKFTIDEEEKIFVEKEKWTDMGVGKHELTAKIYGNNGHLIGQLDYYVWVEEKKARILHKKYEYRISTSRKAKDYQQVIESHSVAQEIKNILDKSFIAKRGECWYYNNGASGSFLKGKDLLTVQKSANGKLLLPLKTTSIELGASSVKMEKGSDMVVQYENKKIRSIIGSNLIRITGDGFKVEKIKTPVSLYLNKAMAGGEIYEYLTGRRYIEKENLIIILPLKTKLDKNKEAQIIEAAQRLFR